MSKELDFLNEPPPNIIDIRSCPNRFPRLANQKYRIAIIGELPSKEELEQGTPFLGNPGYELDKWLSKNGVFRDACFLGLICQKKSITGRLVDFDWTGPEIQNSLSQLKEDLNTFKPNLIFLLGGAALHAFKNPNEIPKQRKKGTEFDYAYPDSIGDWRGSFFLSHCNSPCPDTKCIATYHPLALRRNYSWMPYCMLDAQRAIRESFTPEMPVIHEEFDLTGNLQTILYELTNIRLAKIPVSVDIEGGLNSMSCLSMATSASKSIIIPFTNMDGSSFWQTDDEEVEVWKAVIDILCDPTIPKIWQNGLYDRFVLQEGYNLVVRGTTDDTLLKHWELYCEMEKNLGVQCSIYTNKPFYKSQRHAPDRESFWRYCCRDSAVTFEINERMNRILNHEDYKSSRQHYQFNLILLNSLLYMEFRGLCINKPEIQKRLQEVEKVAYETQYDLDQITGKGLTSKDKTVLMALVRETMCMKRNPTQPKKEYIEDYNYAMRILHGNGELTKYELARINMGLGRSLNIAGKEFKDFLYKTLALPEQRSKVTKALTANYETLITLFHAVKQNKNSVKKSNKELASKALPVAIELGSLWTRTEHLTSLSKCDIHFKDSRVHSSYNEVGSETGRITCSKFLNGDGYPMQTVESDNDLRPIGHPLHSGLRNLVHADSDCYLYKADLKGADGWTIGSCLAALGNTTMLDDLKAGIKPAARLCYMMREFRRGNGLFTLQGKTKNEIKELLKEVKKEDWDYFAFKQCVWGFCYQLGESKASNLVFTASEGQVYIPEDQMLLAKNALLRVYGISTWWRGMESFLKQPYPPKFTSPSGHIRKFFARSQEILGQALAHLPQSITTYMTNRATFNCWNDPENRRPDGTLRLEPMHQVHDEFLTQGRIEDNEWNLMKIKQWFNNPITIHGITLVIPFDGAYGTNWNMDEESKKGNI